MLIKLKYYISALMFSALMLQLYISFLSNSEIDAWARVLLVIIILGAFTFRFVNRRVTITIAYLDFFIHSIAFLIINMSFWLHAGYLHLQNSQIIFTAGWVGVLVIMPAIWGIGLLLEAITTFFSKACKLV